MTTNTIINIEINRIDSHPHNPRKDLGDITELAESIRANGILQNLTVVPWFTEITGVRTYNDRQKSNPMYRVVIGHRRLAAAKLAGLTEVPCAVAEMDERAQIATMLLENMQRNDLTLWEQAQGFQLMLDYGESVKGISEKTGFSERTVQRRMKLLELDGTKFKESVERGATLSDYEQLDQIKDKSVKNNVLEKIGTPNFQYALRQAVEDEEWRERRTKLIAELERFAVRSKTDSGFLRIQYFSRYSTDELKKPDDAGSAEYYFYTPDDCSYIYLLAKEPKSAERDEKLERLNAERRELEERRSRLDEISRRAYNLRVDFIKEYSAAKKHAADIMELAVKSIVDSGWHPFDAELFSKILGIDTDGEEDREAAFDTAVFEKFAASPARVLLAAAYCNEFDNEHWSYYNYFCKYSGNEDLDKVYNSLRKLGYEESDEEIALSTGTHELYVKEETEGDK